MAILTPINLTIMSTRVIILAAGKGTRMGADIPKPLVEIAGRPMVEHLLDSVRDSGVDQNPILVVAPDATELFGELCRGQSCEYVVQEEQLGTGDAVKAAESACGDAEHVIVLYGDHPFISEELMEQLQSTHKAGDAVITMVTTKVPNFSKEHKVFERWGRIKRDESMKVLEIVEAKDADEEILSIKELNSGIYAFDGEWLWEHLPQLQNKNASGEYYLTDLVEMAIEEGLEVSTIDAKPFEVIGINTKEELQMAEEYFS